LIFGLVQVVPRLVGRFGNARLLAAGALLTLIGMVWLSRISAGSDYVTGVALPLVILGLGAGLTFGPLTAAGISGVEPADAGAASGLVNVAHQVGGSLGIGVLITVFTAATPHAATVQGLAHGVSTTVAGSAVLDGLALLVILATMLRRPTAVTAAESEPAEIEAVNALSEAA
jgi:hypothetical protein